MREVSARHRVIIVEKLSSIGTPAAEAALLDALSDPSLFVRGFVIGELMNIDPDREPGPILRALSDSDGESSIDEPSPEDVVRAQLHRLTALDTVPILIRGLAADEQKTRARSAGVLGEVADRRSEPALAAAAARDPHRRVRNAAREALKTIRSSPHGRGASRHRPL